MEMSVQLHTSAALLPRKEIAVPRVQDAGWATELVWMLWSREKSIASVESWTQILSTQPKTCHYTDWAIPALQWNSVLKIN
jgi:hypothetical protein